MSKYNRNRQGSVTDRLYHGNSLPENGSCPAPREARPTAAESEWKSVENNVETQARALLSGEGRCEKNVRLIVSPVWYFGDGTSQ